MPSEKENHHFYGRRKLRPLRAERSDALEQGMERFILPEEILEQDVIDPQKIFPDKKIWLEIGFGNGEHLVEQAMRNPDIGLIGCEPFINGVAFAAREIVTHKIENARLWPDDAVPLMAKFPDQSLDRVFLLFNDPWPKTRHYKRRFIQPHIVELLARLMKPGAQLRLATDDKSLAEWMLLHTVTNTAFRWNHWQDGDWSTQPDDWIETRYQQKAVQQGRLAHYLDFTRT
jgi:tRNA (guanine-N7-)-methyltransferase